MSHWLPYLGVLAPSAAASPLLAQVEKSPSPLWDMGRNFREANQDFQWINVIVVAGIVAAIGVALWLLLYYASQREKRSYNHSGSLFNELCRAHELDRNSRRLLKQVARELKLAQPALLFVAPERFPEPASSGSWAKKGAQLSALRAKIYGSGVS